MHAQAQHAIFVASLAASLLSSGHFAQTYLAAEHGRTIYPADKFYDFAHIQTDSGTITVPLMGKGDYYSFVYYPILTAFYLTRSCGEWLIGTRLGLAMRMASPLLQYGLIDPLFPVNYRYFTVTLTAYAAREYWLGNVGLISGVGLTSRIGKVSAHPAGGPHSDIPYSGSPAYGKGVSLTAAGIAWSERILFNLCSAKSCKVLLSLTIQANYFLAGTGRNLYPFQVDLSAGIVWNKTKAKQSAGHSP